MIEEPQNKHTDETVRSIKLFIAVPCYGGKVNMLTSISLLSLTNALQNKGISHVVRMLNGEMVARARNRLADEFMDSDCTHLFFIDSDIGFRPVDVIEMVMANVHVIGGVYPLKGYNFKRIIEQADTQPDIEGKINLGLDYVVAPHSEVFIDGDGQKKSACRMFRNCLQVNELGTGFLMISRLALEQFRNSFPDLFYMDDFPGSLNKKISLFFNYEIINSRYLSEDYFFCAKWREIGGRIWAWTAAELAHEGYHVFQGRFDRNVRPVNQPIIAQNKI